MLTMTQSLFQLGKVLSYKNYFTYLNFCCVNTSYLVDKCRKAQDGYVIYSSEYLTQDVDINHLDQF